MALLAKGTRIDILLRDGHACVHCGSKKDLTIDHIIRRADRPDLKYDYSNLQTLCRPCHTIKDGLHAKVPSIRYKLPEFIEVGEKVKRRSKKTKELDACENEQLIQAQKKIAKDKSRRSMLIRSMKGLTC